MLLHETTSLCKACKNAVPARVVTRGDEVWMEKTCLEHGPQEVMLSDDAGWYQRTRAIPTRKAPPKRAPKKIEAGCPFDCGACESHEQKVRLPVVTITSACNLDCPICYVHNKNEGAYHMSVEDFRRILDHLREDHDGDIDLVNFTGGEPTLHPHFLELLEMARDAGVHRVSICTNGIKLAKDEALVARLKELGARIALSFDTFEMEADFALQGAHLVELKLQVMDLLEKHDVDTTLIPVMTRGLNDGEIGKIIRYALGKRNVRHLEVHTITYTGQGGTTFPREGRISMHEVLRRIEETTGGMLAPDDFVPSPCAHPLCYQIAYLLMDPAGGPPVPFTRLLDRETIRECLTDHLYLEPTPKVERAMQDAIDRLWSEGTEEGERVIAVIKGLLRDVSLRAWEKASKAIYVHSHMDEETFDTERIAKCCDSNCYPDGSTIPVCSYNILYREEEEHFMMKPVARPERRGGKRLPVVQVRP
jgi:7,8-dihydro-6-hydroxymethylpterin dimethyltransferase